jgi:pyruvate kinase
MLRRTKILATMGPSTDDPKIVDELIAAGVDVVRINLSHGSHEEHANRAETVRNRARASGRQVGVLADLQGPKIRIGRFVDGVVDLQEGAQFALNMELGINDGDIHQVGVTYPQLADDVARGDTLLLDDGAVVLWVSEVENRVINCKVVVGGKLTNNKGINKQFTRDGRRNWLFRMGPYKIHLCRSYGD